MPDLLDQLVDDLVRAGISPRHARRYRQELAEHLHDLMDELQQGGLSPPLAREEAWTRLGTKDQLALPVLLDRRFRSRICRSPLLWLLVLPLLSQPAVYVALVFTLVTTARPLLEAGLLHSAGDLISIAWLIWPAPAGWLLLHTAKNRHMHLGLPITALLLNAAIAASLKVTVVAPETSSGAGMVAVAFTAPSPAVWLSVATSALLPLPFHHLKRLLP